MGLMDVFTPSQQTDAEGKDDERGGMEGRRGEEGGEM